MKNIIIFGTAKRGSELLAILSQLPQYRVVAFSCNDETAWGNAKEWKYGGIEIIPPVSMRSLYPDAMVIIASASYAEIEKQLVEGGLLPDGGCVRIQQIIGELSDQERASLNAAVERETCFYDLNYREVPIPPDDSSAEKYLVICTGGYPKEGNPRCMFAHERVLQYRKAGLQAEAFGLVGETAFEEYEYQGVKVFQGGALELQRFLKSRNYKKLLIHFVEPNVMHAIEQAGKADMPMIVWCHGYEVLPWYRCWFNYTEEEQQKRTALYRQDAEKRTFLKGIYAKENIEFIFVSAWQMGRSEKYVGRLPEHCRVIHNFIDHDFFALPEKTAQDRCRILSVKRHSTRTYANDLTAKAILELSRKSFFSELTFELYGDGTLFDENFGELLKCGFPNVHIHRKFLNHYEMRDLFRENGIFLSPTRMDTQGVTANEAMASGMAVISCNTSAIPEFIDESCASLFEYDNHWMMAEEIEYLYYHPDEFVRKAKNARARIVEQCGYDKTLKRELDLILQEKGAFA